MNAFLWIGVVSAGVLILAAILDGLDLDFGLDSIFNADWLNLAVLSAFTGGFGFAAGAVYPAMGLWALLPGAALGIGLAFLAAHLVRRAKAMDSGRADTEQHLIGSIGTVVTPIGPGLGEVLVQRPSGPMKLAARSDENLGIATTVVVIDVSSSTLVTVQELSLPTVHKELP